jgi:hypothetical protein
MPFPQALLEKPRRRRETKNFSSDMQNSYALLVILERVTPSSELRLAAKHARADPDPTVRARKVRRIFSFNGIKCHSHPNPRSINSNCVYYNHMQLQQAFAILEKCHSAAASVRATHGTILPTSQRRDC